MFGSVTLNPCIDKMVRISDFKIGMLNRITSSQADAAGKGINSSVVYNNLGGKTFCTGINYESNKNIIEDFLTSENIGFDFLNVPGEVRTNLKIFDEVAQVVTEVNASGYKVPAGTDEAITAKLVTLAKDFETILLGGSVPAGLGKDIYAKIIKALKAVDVKVILDADGELFDNGIKEIPYMIKPNDYELELYSKKTFSTHKDMVIIARDEFISKGVNVVGISLGADGALLLDENKVFYAKGMKVDVKGTAGAGDSMIAGITYGISCGYSLDGVLRSGVAAATSSVVKDGTEMCDRVGYDKYFPMVEISEVFI